MYDSTWYQNFGSSKSWVQVLLSIFVPVMFANLYFLLGLFMYHIKFSLFMMGCVEQLDVQCWVHFLTTQAFGISDLTIYLYAHFHGYDSGSLWYLCIHCMHTLVKGCGDASRLHWSKDVVTFYFYFLCCSWLVCDKLYCKIANST